VRYFSLKFNPENEVKLSSIGYGMGGGIDSNLYSESDISSRLNAALSNGINWFDAAESYHGGYAEEILGKSLGQVKDAYFFTKFSPTSGSSKNLKPALNRSLARLKRDYIDVYQMHWPPTKVEDYREIFQLLEDFKKEGKIRGVGVCNFDLQNYTDLQKSEISQICSSQFEYSLFNSENHRNLSEFQSNKKIFSIAYGVLEGIKRRADSPGATDILKILSDKYCLSSSQVVLNWAASKNLAVLTSSRSVARTAENVKSLEVCIDKMDLDAIDFFYPGMSQNVNIGDIEFNQSVTNYYCYPNEIEALENRLNLKPSPVDLAEGLRMGANYKPIKLLSGRRRGGGKYYYLLNGMVRYWAWRLAYPNSVYVPSYIVDID